MPSSNEKGHGSITKHGQTINDAITLPTLLVSLLGAVILLAIYKAIRRR